MFAWVLALLFGAVCALATVWVAPAAGASPTGAYDYDASPSLAARTSDVPSALASGLAAGRAPVDHGYDDATQPAGTSASRVAGFLAPQTGGDDCDGIVQIFKAPQPGFGADQYENGWNPSNLTEDDDPSFGTFATFAKERELADLFARSYGEGVIAVQIPQEVYDANFRMHEYPFEGGPLTELEIPFAKLPLLNQFPRTWDR